MKPAVFEQLAAAAAAACLSLSPSLAAAWQVGALYATSDDPWMPRAEEAIELVSAPAGPLGPLRRAHRQSAERGWHSVSPTQSGPGMGSAGQGVGAPEGSASGPQPSRRTRSTLR